MITKKDIFSEHLEEYLKESRKKKGKILDHVCFVTGLQRKSAIRKFKRLQMRYAGAQEARGRPLVYTPDVTVALKEIWEAGGEVCGELLHPVLHEYVDILKRDGMWKYAPEVTKKLRRMSEGTMKELEAKRLLGGNR